MKKHFSDKIAFLLVLMLVAAMASGCGKKTEDTAAQSVQTEVAEQTSEAAADTEAAEDAAAEEAAEYEKVGEGDTVFYFVSTDPDGNSQYFEVSTNETTVGAALVALGMIEGEDSEYGLYVKTVNGVTVDYDTDGMYWAFYIDGEYASTGVDATDITPGATYTFAAEK